MGEFLAHHVRFFEWTPTAIHCMSYNPALHRLAVSRSDGSVELWSIKDGWYQEEVIPGVEDHSIEDLVWQGQRLFYAGLHGNICELDLVKLQVKSSSPSNAGPVWCLTSNSAQTRLAAGTEEGCVILLNTENGGLEYCNRFDSQGSRILCIAWHPTEDVIVTGGIDNIRLWSVSSGRAMQRLTVARQVKNKETVIWCVAFLSDMTIVSGDSRGKTSFWNGRQGTVIKSIQSHKADVYCLAMDPSESIIVSSGIDSSVVQFNYIAPRENSDWRDWVGTFVHNQHTHDVRAVQIVDKTIITGGVDTNLIQFNLKAKGSEAGGRKMTSDNKWKRIPAIPQKSLVKVARDVNIIMLQYPHHLEVWRLGFTDKTGVNGDILALRSNPIKLIEMKTKAGAPIYCSDISPDATLMAYSDCDMLRVYSINLENLTSIQPNVSMKRVVQSTEHPPDGAHCICFTSDSKKIVTVNSSSCIQICCVESGQIGTEHTFPSKSESYHLLCVSPDNTYAAAADHQCNVHVYHLENLQFVCSVPRFNCQVSALSFSIDSSMVAMAYTNQQVFEYNIEEREYSEWSKRCSQKFGKAWLRRKTKISRIMYNPANADQLVLHDEQMFCILDKTQRFPAHNLSWQELCTPTLDKSSAFHICTNYKFLMHLEVLPENWLIAVERPPLDMYSTLPDALKRKKFGT